MRILNLVSGEKWTGAAAVVFDQTAALVASGVEAQFGFVGGSPLAARLLPLGWARPLLSRPRGPLDYPRDVRRLRDTVLREKFEIVHCHLSHDHFLAAVATRGTGTLVARTFHHLDHVRRDPASRALFRRTDAFAFANRAIAAKFGAEGPVHPPVVDVERFHPGERSLDRLLALGVPPGPGSFVVGTVGKVARGRGHREAIEAVSTLPGDAFLLHVGKGELRGDLEVLAERRGLGARNVWTGYEEEALPDLYRAMDVFVFAGSGSQQGQRAVLEAMASSVPVVALDLPGVRDLLSDGREGVVVASADRLAPALAALRDSPGDRRTMGARGRERARDFEAGAFARAAREFYARLAARKSRTWRAWEAGETAG